MAQLSSPKTRLRILVTGWEGGGNVPPLIAALRGLVARGHDVRLIADVSMKAEAIEAGARFQPWTRAPNRPDRSAASCFVRDRDIADPIAAFRQWSDRIFVGPARDYALDILDALAAEPADLMIGSDLLFGGMLAAEVSRLPLVLLAANISLSPLPGHPPFGPGFQPAGNAAERARDAEVAVAGEALWNQALPALNAARAHFGLAPLTRVLDQTASAGRCLLATSPSFDFPVARMPDHVRYIGPLLEEPSWAVASGYSTNGNGALPTALVSFSTTHQGQDEILRRIVAALGQLPISAVVTLGKALEQLAIEAPGNVEILGSASHEAILPSAQVVVTHGGHGTVLRALRHGVPLVVMPMGRDQNDNAARVEYHRVGIRLDPAASPSDIARAVQDVLTDTSFAERARRMADALAAEGSSIDRLTTEIEAFAAAHRADKPYQAA